MTWQLISLVRTIPISIVYNQVIGTLEFTKELMGQFSKLATDEAKDKKKIMKKELQEKSRDELSKVVVMILLILLY